MLEFAFSLQRVFNVTEHAIFAHAEFLANTRGSVSMFAGQLVCCLRVGCAVVISLLLRTDVCSTPYCEGLMCGGRLSESPPQ